MNTIYLVTGATGHLGNTVIRALLQAGQLVRGLVLPSDHTGALDGLAVELFYGDVCDKESLLDFFQVPQEVAVVVIHTAGIVSITSKYNAQLYRVNVMGTKNIVDLCVEKHVRRLVYVSSVHAIPETNAGGIIREVTAFSPQSVTGAYAKTKAEATQYVLDQVKEKGLNAVILHPSGIIGPGDYGNSHMTQMIDDYLTGKLTACVRGGYDFVDVRDVTAGIIAAVDEGQRGACYILSNRYVSVKELLDGLAKISGKKPIKTVLPLWFAKLTAPLAEIYYRLRKKPPLYTAYSLYTLVSNSNFSHARATGDLGYSTRDIYETLSDAVAWRSEQRALAAGQSGDTLK